MRNLSRRDIIIVGIALAAIAPRAQAAEPAGEKSAGEKSAGEKSGRVALHGYDPVAYFTDHKPEKGMPAFTASFDDATYWFKSAGHRALFVADPDHYAPQFAGFCAVTVARGGKYEADPEAWQIADGKLYVFGEKQLKPYFAAHEATVIAKANANWPRLSAEP